MPKLFVLELDAFGLLQLAVHVNSFSELQEPGKVSVLGLERLAIEKRFDITSRLVGIRE